MYCTRADKSWQAVASSASGAKLVAVQYGAGQIFTSGDAGATWRVTLAPTGFWRAVASSADGVRLVAALYGGLIYASSDSGATWRATGAPSGYWIAVASAADGVKLVAAQVGFWSVAFCVHPLER